MMKTRRPISINNSLAHGICNYSCRLCSVNKKNYRGPKAFQPRAVTEALIHRIEETAAAGIHVRYVANAGDGEPTLHPEFHERMAMFGAMRGLARKEGLDRIADGLQMEDLGDDRPGRRAAAEAGVLHPLRDAGLDKVAVRRLARALGLEIHAKPAQPCLSSRLPPGVEVTLERLRRVHRAESALRELGYRQVRVRCEDRHGRIEIGEDELGRALEEAARLEAVVLESGFGSATVDSEGYRVGGAYR